MKKTFAWRVILNAIGLYLVTEYLVAGIQVDSTGALLIAAVVLGVVNAIIRPVVIILSLPINIITLGLLTLIINGFMLKLTAGVVPGFTIDSFWTAVWGAIILSIISYLLNSLIRDRK